MSDALFTDLSIEQQEVVAGGDGFPNISDKVNTYYNLNVNKQYMNFLVTSGSYGSLSSQQYVTESTAIKTGASKYFNFSSNPI